jgi:hypothetical protein
MSNVERKKQLKYQDNSAVCGNNTVCKTILLTSNPQASQAAAVL